MAAMGDDLVAFYRARLDEDEAAVRDHLCINCGHYTVPLRSPLGVTGYTHDGRMSNGQWENGWQGVRCPSRLTGATPVQNPDRVLREVAAGRRLIERYERAIAVGGKSPSSFVNGQDNGYWQACLDAISDAAAVYDGHLGYRQEWKPAG